jgi:DNA-binding transcriptional LysR family regulator
MRDNWDDLRFVLAVADTGSVSAAARLLGVNHATVLRRIAAFEDAAGTAIFDKSARGYAVPGDRARVIDAAREVDAGVQSVLRLLRGAHAPLSGEVRVTTTDSLGQLILPGVLADLQLNAPELRIEVLSSNAHLDLSRSHADLTIRPAEQLSDDLNGQVGAHMAFFVYRRKDSDPQHWIGTSGALARSRPGRWMESEVMADQRNGAADSFMVMAALCATGQGRAILPAFVGDAVPALERVDGVAPPMTVDIWVATHPDFARIPRIARVRALLVSALGERQAMLSGTAGAA